MDSNIVRARIVERAMKQTEKSVYKFIMSDDKMQQDLVWLYLYTAKPQRTLRKEYENCKSFLYELFGNRLEISENYDVADKILGATIQRYTSYSYSGEVDFGTKKKGRYQAIELRRRSFNPYDKFTTWKAFPYSFLILAFIATIPIINKFCPGRGMLYLIGPVIGILLYTISEKRTEWTQFKANAFCAAAFVVVVLCTVVHDYIEYNNEVREFYFGLVLCAGIHLACAVLSLLFENRLKLLCGTGWTVASRTRVG